MASIAWRVSREYIRKGLMTTSKDWAI